MFEGNPSVDPKAKYPLCVEGERACPPEDCGGVWGYADFLEAIPIRNTKNTRARWSGSGAGSTRKNSTAKAATRAMKKGLPDCARCGDDEPMSVKGSGK